MRGGSFECYLPQAAGSGVRYRVFTGFKMYIGYYIGLGFVGKVLAIESDLYKACGTELRPEFSPS